jgi:hypothetical protein
VAKLGADLQKQGAESFDDSWQDLLKAIQSKSQALKQPARRSGTMEDGSTDNLIRRYRGLKETSR